MSELENRVAELETKIAFQDDTIEQLNNEISHHQEKLQLMQHQLELLGKKIQENQSTLSEDNMIEPPPPHY